MSDSFIARLLIRSGALAHLRRLWRADDTAQRQTVERLAEENAAKGRTAQKGTDKGLRDLRARLERTIDASKVTATTAARLERDVATIGEKVQARTTVDASLLKRLDALEREVSLTRATLQVNLAHRQRPESGPFDYDAVATHIAAAIASAVMHEEPAAHMVVENLLPDATYDTLLEAIPPDIFFSQRDQIKQNLKISSVDVVPDRTLDGLRFLEHEIIGGMIVPRVMERFGSYVRRVYDGSYGPALAPKVAALPHVATAGRLMLRRPGYHLDPHLDPRRVVVTVLIYFARPGDSEAFGTSFYWIDGALTVNQSNTLYPQEQGLVCRLAKTVLFRRNTAVIFLNGTAAHGAGIPASAPENTKRYAYQFYISPEAEGLARLLDGDSTVGREVDEPQVN